MQIDDLVKAAFEKYLSPCFERANRLSLFGTMATNGAKSISSPEKGVLTNLDESVNQRLYRKVKVGV